MGKRERYLEDRIVNSYYTYLFKRDELKVKGYSLYEPLSREEYIDYYKLAASRGDKNIARSFAENDKYIKYSEARRIYKKYKDSGIMTPREIIGIDPSTLPRSISPRQALFLAAWEIEQKNGTDSEKAREIVENVLYG